MVIRLGVTELSIIVCMYVYVCINMKCVCIVLMCMYVFPEHFVVKFDISYV